MVMISRVDNEIVNANRYFVVDNSTPDNPSGTIPKSGDRVISRVSLDVFDPGVTTGDRKTPNSHGFIRERIQYGPFVRYETNYYGLLRGSYANHDVTSYGMSPIASAFGSTPVTPGGFDAAPWSGQLDTCMEKVYNQIRGDNNLVVDWTERQQTIKMLKNVVSLRKNIVTFCKWMSKDRTFKRIRRTRGESRAHEYVAGKWLEWRYGWLPFMHSIYDAADTLRRDVSVKTVTVKGRSGVRYNGRITEGLGTYTNPKGIVQYSSSYRTEVGITFNLPGGLSVNDWTSLNPAVIGWELLTLSFVADWVWNVGQQLSLMENHNIFSKHFAGGYVTTGVKETRLAHFEGNTNYPPSGYWESGMPFNGIASGRMYGFARVDLTKKHRTKLLSLPTPTGFALKVNLNATKVVDAAAICSGMVRKLLKR